MSCSSRSPAPGPSSSDEDRRVHAHCRLLDELISAGADDGFTVDWWWNLTHEPGQHHLYHGTYRLTHVASER